MKAKQLLLILLAGMLSFALSSCGERSIAESSDDDTHTLSATISTSKSSAKEDVDKIEELAEESVQELEQDYTGRYYLVLAETDEFVVAPVDLDMAGCYMELKANNQLTFYNGSEYDENSYVIYGDDFSMTQNGVILEGMITDEEIILYLDEVDLDDDGIFDEIRMYFCKEGSESQTLLEERLAAGNSSDEYGNNNSGASKISTSQINEINSSAVYSLATQWKNSYNSSVSYEYRISNTSPRTMFPEIQYNNDQSVAIVYSEIEYWIGGKGGNASGSVTAAVVIDMYTGEVLSSEIL